jgi:hypothetical protein
VPPLDLTRALDTAIRAPLWIYFAFAVGFALVVFDPFAILTLQDVAAIKSLLGPPAFWLLLSASLFASSFVARFSGGLGKGLKKAWEAIELRFKLSRLSSPARATLALFEIEGAQTLMLVAGSEHVTSLRDSGFLHAVLIGRNLEWGSFRLKAQLERLRRTNPAKFRRLTRASTEEANGARQSMNIAFRRARGRV